MKYIHIDSKDFITISDEPNLEITSGRIYGVDDDYVMELPVEGMEYIQDIEDYLRNDEDRVELIHIAPTRGARP